MDYNFLDISGYFFFLGVLTYLILGCIFVLDVFYDNLHYLRKKIYIRKRKYENNQDLKVFEFTGIKLSDLEKEIKKIRKLNPYNEYLGVLRDTISQEWDEEKPVETIVHAVVVLEADKMKYIWKRR